MKAVIMAGGKGTRLRPLTCNTPKPMVPLLDRPVMEYTIELLKDHGITDIAVTVQYLPEVIRQYFGDGSEYGVNLHYFEEETPLGTAGSVKNAEEFLDETFIVISGDALTDFNITAALRYHNEKKAMATLMLTHVETPLEYGVVMTDERGEIIRFLEKPSWGEVFSDTVNTGIYILEPEIFRYFEKGKEFDFSKDLFPLLMKHLHPLYGYVAKGYWSDIGNLTQYRQTQFDMLEGLVSVHIPGKEIAPKVWIGKEVFLGNDIALNGPAFIGDGSTIGDQVHIGEYSIIGGGSYLRNGVQIERTVLWKNVFAEQGTDLKGATLCRGVRLRSGAIIGEDSVIGDSCYIGTKSIVQAGIKIWPNKSVEDHTTLNTSLIWGERVTKNLFGQFGVTGICNVEITTSFANRLALAYGSTLPFGGTVGIGCDASPFAKLIAKSLASGLHASGLHTYSFGPTTSAVNRYGCHQLDCIGGIHIRMVSEEEQDLMVIEILDQYGLPISKGTERKIENAYYQEDSRRIDPGKVGRKKTSPQVGIFYRDALLNMVDKDTIQAKEYKIVIEYDYRNLNTIIPELLEALGCKLILLNRVISSPDELAQWVSANQADFGIQLNGNAMQATFVTDKGMVVSEEQLFILQIMAQLHSNEGENLFVPVNAPSIVGLLAEQYNRKVIRTKADPRSIMEGCTQQGFHIFYDGLFTLVQVLQMMTEKHKSLNQLIQTIPQFTLLKQQVHCPWTEKGKVMRFLMEETKGNPVELIDGIKVFHDGGWTLILPDNEKPVFQVVANAENVQLAEEMASIYTRKIQEYRLR